MYNTLMGFLLIFWIMLKHVTIQYTYMTYISYILWYLNRHLKQTKVAVPYKYILQSDTSVYLHSAVITHSCTINVLMTITDGMARSVSIFSTLFICWLLAGVSTTDNVLLNAISTSDWQPGAACLKKFGVTIWLKLISLVFSFIFYIIVTNWH
jgi:hypothetical protein